MAAISSTVPFRSRARIILSQFSTSSPRPLVCLSRSSSAPPYSFLGRQCAISKVRHYSANPPPAPPDRSTSSPPLTESTLDASTDPPQSSDPAVPNPIPEDELPSTMDSRRGLLAARFATFMDNAQRAATETSHWASNATGTSYGGIERLKNQNAELESQLAKAKETLNKARKEYQDIVQRRLHTQKEVNMLLARKDGWTPTDLERFTTLYRDDHSLDSTVGRAGEELATAERQAERLRERLISGILGRYHEEQIWSDRIRRLSTWGTWGLMSVNVLLFLLFQFGAEPWRRARLVKGFEEKVAEGVRQVLDEERERTPAYTTIPPPPIHEGETGAMGIGTGIVSNTEEQPPSKPIKLIEPELEAEVEPDLRMEPELEMSTETWMDVLRTPYRWKSVFLDLSSDRTVSVRMRDMSLLAAESALAGAILAGTLVIVVVRVRL